MNTRMDRLRNRSPGLVRVARYADGRHAGVSVEGALAVSLLVVALALVMDIVMTVQLQNRVERVAWAVARANALESGPAASEADLEARIQAVISAEPGVNLDPKDFEIELIAYDTPSELPTDTSTGTPSTRPSAKLGGDPSDIVVVRVRYAPSDSELFQWLVGGNGISSVAWARNETELSG